MPSLVRQTLLMPLWLAQVFSQEKFFARNPIIGNRWLNEHGLHTARVATAWRLAETRRRRLARLISAEDRRQLDSDGFIVKRDFLPPDVFADLLAQVRALRAPAREITEGDTITRHIALDPAALDRVPAARRLIDLPQYRNLLSYAGSSAAAPMVYIQTVLAGAVAGPPDPASDPQRDLHTDTFHPTVKAWLFLTDVEPDAMPFVYVPGSHRLTPQRLEWERAMSIRASRKAGEPEQKLIRAISPAMLSELGLPPPQAISAPANSLVVADTFGFHARGPSVRKTTRVEIWALGRRNPFLPWTGLDPWSIAALGLRKPMLYWKSVDLLESIGLAHQRWRARGLLSAFDPAYPDGRGMDQYQAYAPSETSARDAASGRATVKRSFLFLQGPISSCFDRLGRALIARGHRVHRINLHFGDQLFWRLPATHFRGHFADWRGFVARMLEQHQITDLVLHGDRRPYHIAAAEEARARGIAVFVTDLGYVRPDWITLEYDGMTTYSRFPRDPAAIRALAAELPEPDLGPRFQTPFWLIAALDVAYNLGLVFGRPLYPHYRYHSTCHPFAEYAGWLWSRAKRRLTARASIAKVSRLEAQPGSYFLVPLQLSTDFQIRAHSPFCDLREAVRAIVASFAASGSPRQLVFVVHPLDNGLIGWSRFIARLARESGVAERVLALHGGTPAALLRNAAGVVTINSTVGVTALHQGVPVKALGNAVFDIAGLTCQAPLDVFWDDPQPPNPALLADFLRALTGTTQVKGGYYERASQACAVAGIVERLERRPYPLPVLSAADLAARPPRAASRSVVVTGVSDTIGVALARAQAAPGVRLCLVGDAAETLEVTAEDCRQRGALVETFCPAGKRPSALADYLEDLDRDAPVDALMVHGAAASEPTDARLAERDISYAMRLVVAIGEKMRRRGRGEIVLVSPLAGRAATGEPRTMLGITKAFLTYGVDLRRRMRASGVSVAIVAPSRLAIRAAAWLHEPSLAMAGADRLAEQIERGMRRHRAVIAVPGRATLALRLLRPVPSQVREALRDTLLPSANEIGEPGDDATIAEKSATGGTAD